MHRYLWVCVLVFVLALGGCLPTARTRTAEQLDGYVGGGYTALAATLGTPTLSGETRGNGWVYTWRDCRVVFDIRGVDESRYCEIRAWVDENGIVERWDWWGNECPLEGVASGCHGLLWWQP